MCRFVSTQQLQRQNNYVETCNILDNSCSAKCDCSDGFVGKWCDTSQNVLLSRQVARNALILRLVNDSSFDDPLLDSFETHGALLSALVESPDEIYQDTQRILGTNILSNLKLARTKGFPLHSTAPFFSTLDSFTVHAHNSSGGNNLNKQSRDDTKEAIKLFMDIGSNEVVTGQTRILGLQGKSLRMCTNFGDQLSLPFWSAQQQFLFEETGGDISKPMVVSHSTSSNNHEQTLALASLDSSLYDVPLAVKFNSKPLLLRAVNSLSECEANNNTYSATIVLNNNKPMNYDNNAIVNWQSVTCADGATQTTVYCGTSLFNLSCNSTARSFNVSCPIRTEEPTCSLLSHSAFANIAPLATNSNNSDIHNKYKCIMLSYTSSQTECLCSLPCSSSVESDRNGRRRISSTREFDNSVDPDGIGSAEIVAMAEFITSDFISNVVSLQYIESDIFLDADIVFIFYLVAISMTVVLSCVAEAIFAESEFQSINKKRMSSISGRNGTNDMTKEAKRAKDLSDVSTFINSLFPGSLGNQDNVLRLSREILRAQFMARIFNSKNFMERSIIGLQFLTMIIVSSFLIAFFFSIQYPFDDGTCAAENDEISCLNHISAFDRDQTTCSWLGNQNGEYNCVWNEVVMNLEVVVVVMIVTVLITGPIYMGIEFIFLVLNSPTTTDIDEIQNINSNMRSFMFAVSNKARQSILGPFKTAPESSSNTSKTAPSRARGKRVAIMPMMAADSSVGNDKNEGTKSVNDDLEALSVDKDLSHTKLFDETMTYPHEFNIRHRIAAEAAILRVGKNNNSIERELLKMSLRHDSSLLNSNSLSYNNSADGLLLLSDTALSYPIDAEYRAEFLEIVRNLDTDLLAHRKSIIKADDRTSFDKQWGLFPSALYQFPSPQDIGKSGSQMLQERDAHFIVKKIANALITSKLFVNKFSTVPDHQAGTELIRLYVQDFLGPETNHSGTFTSKHNAEFCSKRASSVSLKVSLGLFVIAVNVFLILVCMSYGNERGRKWQKSWLLTVLFKILIDLVFSQFFNGLIIGFLLPNLLMSDLALIRKKLLRSGEKLITSTSPYKFSKFSASDFTFASSLVAKQMPHLIEARLILVHRDNIPERIFQRRCSRLKSQEEQLMQTSKNTPGIKMKMRILYQSFSYLFVQFALAFGSLSQDVQSVIIFVIPSTLVLGISWFFILISNNQVLFLAFLLAIVCLILSLMYSWIIAMFNIVWKCFTGGNSRDTRDAEQKIGGVKSMNNRMVAGISQRFSLSQIDDFSDPESSDSDDEEMVRSTAPTAVSAPAPVRAVVPTPNIAPAPTIAPAPAPTPVPTIASSVTVNHAIPVPIEDNNTKGENPRDFSDNLNILNLEFQSKMILISSDAAATRHRGSLLRKETTKHDRLIERLKERKIKSDRESEVEVGSEHDIQIDQIAEAEEVSEMAARRAAKKATKEAAIAEAAAAAEIAAAEKAARKAAKKEAKEAAIAEAEAAAEPTAIGGDVLNGFDDFDVDEIREVESPVVKKSKKDIGEKIKEKSGAR